MNRWMNRQTNEEMDWLMDEWIAIWTNEQTNWEIADSIDRLMD